MQKIDYTNAVMIVNPVSGIGDQKERKRTIKKAAEKYGWHGQIFVTTLKKTAYHIAKDVIKKGTNHLIICGGDGTIMEVLKAVIKKPVTLGIIPLGTGNLLAKNLSISMDLDEAMHTALRGKPRKLDVGQANDRYFSIIAGIGLDAKIMKDAHREMKNTFGLFAYVLSTLKNLSIKRSVFRIIIDTNHQVTYTAKSVMVANMAKITGGINVVPHANPQSGTLKIGIVKANGLFSWMNLLFNAIKGNVNKSSHYTLLKGKRIVIQSLRGPKPYQCDGDDFPPTEKLVVEIFPKAVSVMG